MKCSKHPKRNTVMETERELKKGHQSIEFTIGLCRECQIEWLNYYKSKGWKTGELQEKTKQDTA